MQAPGCGVTGRSAALQLPRPEGVAHLLYSVVHLLPLSSGHHCMGQPRLGGATEAPSASRLSSTPLVAQIKQPVAQTTSQILVPPWREGSRRALGGPEHALLKQTRGAVADVPAKGGDGSFASKQKATAVAPQDSCDFSNQM